LAEHVTASSGLVLDLVAQFVEDDERPLRCCAFDATGSFLAVGSNNGSLRALRLSPALVTAAEAVWTGTSASSLPVVDLSTSFEWKGLHRGSVYDVAWSNALHPSAMWDSSQTDSELLPPPTLLATGSNDTSAAVCGWQYTLPHELRAKSARLHPNLPLGGRPSGAGTTSFKPKCGTVRSVVFTSEAYLVTGGGTSDFGLRLWDVAAQASEPVSVLHGHGGTVHSLAPCNAYDPRSLVLSGADDATVRLWDCRAGRGDGVVVASGFGAPVLSIAYDETGSGASAAGSSVGGTVAVGTSDGDVCLVDPRRAGDSSRAIRCTERLHVDSVRTVGFTPKGTAIVSAGFDGCIVLSGSGTATSPGSALAVWHTERPVRSERLLSAKWHPHLPLLAVTNASGRLTVYQVGPIE
jgi:WD40 repeat protein